MAHSPPLITISHASSGDAATSVIIRNVASSPPSQVIPTPPTQALLPAQLQGLKKGIDYENLDDLLRKKAIQHEDSRISSFWPPSLVGELVTRVRIQEEFEQIRKKRHAQQANFNANLADEIYRKFRKVFAILILLGKGHLITHFIDEGVNDSDLPLVACAGKTDTDYELARKSAPSKPLRCVQRLKHRHTRESFSSMQHRLEPAFLSLRIDSNSGRRDIRHEHYDPTVILPIEQRVRKDQGGFGIVSRVRINPRCHGFSNVLGTIKTDDEFALKELTKQPNAEQSEDDREFWNEVDQLKRFSGFSHPHLVTLLMTWTIRNTYFMLFPLAEYDLNQYLDNSLMIPDSCTGLLDLGMLQWISKQIFGIAGALNTIHNPRAGSYLSIDEQRFGRHGDLKPENILWYRSSEDSKGILVIADLGLAALNSILSRSNISNGKVPGTPRYRPPEYDIDGGRISRSYDIWTLGCLLLEVVCWALTGPEGRRAFAIRRSTIYINGCGSDIFFGVERDEKGHFVMSVKQQVTQEITALHRHAQCSQFFHDLLDLIEEKMLVVISGKQKRVSAADLVTEITQMHGKATNDGSGYCQTPCPKSQKRKSYDPVKAKLRLEILKNAHHSAVSVYIGKSQPAATAEQLAG